MTTPIRAAIPRWPVSGKALTFPGRRSSNAGREGPTMTASRPILLGALLGLALLPMAAAAAEAKLTCQSDPMIIACFEAYKTGLRSFHGKQLDAIVDRIEESREWKMPIDHVSLVGHASKFKTSDPVDENSRKRAESVAEGLSSRLEARGIRGVRIDQTRLGIAVPRTTNSTQTGRALNRRVEIFLGNRGYLRRRVKALGGACERSGGAETRVIQDEGIPCVDDREALQVCREHAGIAADRRLVGAVCNPLEIRCVVCRGRRG